MLIYWVWYAGLNGISLAQKLALLQHFRDPEELFHTRVEGLRRIPGITEAALEALKNKNLSEAEAILKCCAEKGIGILPLGDEHYPNRLRNTYDPPLVLYFMGTLPDWEAIPVIGVVGTRKATAYGMNTALRFGRQIAQCGALVVSGGASGIDTMAMQGALDADKPVVGVLGCGVDVVYPKTNKQLFSQVIRSGCLISEYPPKTQPKPWHFPERNRIISGISNGLLVVEAPEKSGALITAKRALEQGRDVFAVPGNIDVPACAGSNGLLQDRAMAALSGWDVVKEYDLLYPGQISRRERAATAWETELKVAESQAVPEKTVKRNGKIDKISIDNGEKSTYSVLDKQTLDLSEAEQTVLSAIPQKPAAADEVIARVQLPAGTVKAILTKLTLKRLVINHPGGHISRK